MKIRKIKKQLQRALNEDSINDWVVFKKCLYPPKIINTLFDRYNLCLQDCNFKFKNKLHFIAEAYTYTKNNKIIYVGVEQCKTKIYQINYYIFVYNPN